MANLTVGMTPQSKAEVNQFAGQLLSTLASVLRDCRRFKADFLDTKTTGDLTSAPFAYVSPGPPDEVGILKSAFSDAVQLADIHDGLANLAVAKDFNAFAKQIRRPV